MKSLSAAITSGTRPSRGLSRVPEAGRLSVPRAGRTLLANVRQWGAPLFDAYIELRSWLARELTVDECARYYATTYNVISHPKGLAHINSDTTLCLCTSALLLNWLSARTLGAISESDSLYSAERWALGEAKSANGLARKCPLAVESLALSGLRTLDYGAEFLDIMPYALEVLETKDEIVRSLGVKRKSKRVSGIFYTPSDVADYIVSTVYDLGSDDDSLPAKRTWLDPACGTGVFLLSVLYNVSPKYGTSPGDCAIEFASNQLFGVDISPIALQSAAYSLALACLSESDNLKQSFDSYLHVLGRNFAVADATQINTPEQLGAIFPALRKGADCIVSNPPYAHKAYVDVVDQGLLFPESDVPLSKRVGNIYPLFVRMLATLSNPARGAGGMVVPLSVAFSSRPEFRELRKFLADRVGVWKLAHFDRTPDSLFGDDVKTRNSLVFYDRHRCASAQLLSTDLIRWNSRNRETLFRKIEFTPVQILNDFGIPKVGDRLAYGTLKQLFDKYPNGIGKVLSPSCRPLALERKLIRTAATAYNWIPVQIFTGNADQVQSDKAGTYWEVVPAQDIQAVFAVLSSRLVYWLWRVLGDGFHLTSHFLSRIPVPFKDFTGGSKNALGGLGGDLWSHMSERAIHTNNAGKTSVTYSPIGADDTLDRIDEILISELNLAPELLEYLKRIVHNTIVAGRDR